MVNLLVVKGFENGTKNFTNLHVFKADKISRNGEQFSTLALRTLHKPFITPGLLPTGFNNFLFFCHTVRLNKSYHRAFLV